MARHERWAWAVTAVVAAGATLAQGWWQRDRLVDRLGAAGALALVAATLALALGAVAFTAAVRLHTDLDQSPRMDRTRAGQR